MATFGQIAGNNAIGKARQLVVVAIHARPNRPSNRLTKTPSGLFSYETAAGVTKPAAFASFTPHYHASAELAQLLASEIRLRSIEDEGERARNVTEDERDDSSLGSEDNDARYFDLTCLTSDRLARPRA
jgi:hypothetical protein